MKNKLIDIIKAYHKIGIIFFVIAIAVAIISIPIQWYYFPNISSTLTIIIFITIIGFEMFFYNFLKAFIELWQENHILTISFGLAYLFISLIIIATKKTPEEITKNIIIPLTTIAALLFAFTPKGLIAINDKFRYKRIYQPYNPEKLLKKTIDISYFLSIFVGLTILDILITPLFQSVWLKSKTKESLYYVYFISNNKLLEIITTIYLAILVYSIMCIFRS